MLTVSHAVENAVRRSPFLEEALVRGIINYAALAQIMKPEIEKETGEKVRHAAVMMALRRLSEKLKGGDVGQVPVKFGGGDVTIKSSLFEITILKSSSSIETIKELYGLVDFSRGDVLNITHGMYEITLISNSKYLKEIKHMLRNEHIVKTITGLASLSIKIPANAVETAGYFYVVIKALNWDNINIVEVVSTLTEMIYLLDEKDVTVAFNIVKDIVS